MQDRDLRAAGNQGDKEHNCTAGSGGPGPPHLSSVLLSTAAAIGGTEAETLGAALGVAGIQRKCPQAALVAPRALHVFLEDKQSPTASAASHRAFKEDRDGCTNDQSTIISAHTFARTAPMKH